MFDALATAGINIEMISTSPIRISCVIRKDDGAHAVAVIHDRFGLDEAGSAADPPASKAACPVGRAVPLQ